MCLYHPPIMIPGLGGMNPAQMKAMMRQLGIKSEDVAAQKVVIEMNTGKRLVFESPQVTVVDMKGSKTYTIVGNPVEESGEEGFSREDVELVMAQTGCDTGTAEKALVANEGNIALAIAALKKE